MSLSANSQIDASDFNNLVTLVKNECARRHYNNALSAPNISTKYSGDKITYSDISALLSSLCGLDAFPNTLDTSVYIASNISEQYVSLKNFQYNGIKPLSPVTTTVNTAQ